MEAPAVHFFDPDSHTYFDDQGVVPSVTQIMNGAGLTVFDTLSEMGVDIEDAQERGTFVHAATAMYDEDDLDLDSVDDDIRGYLDGWISFMKDTGFVIEKEGGIERMVYREDWRYAGTLDRVGTLNGLPTILDIKTGAPQAATGIQLAAYEFAYDEAVPYQRVGVYLTADGKYRLETYESLTDLSVFLSALQIMRWKGQHNVK